jgi:anaerobic magnesium-protoporphyrin IX monomethyl ester cyclase
VRVALVNPAWDFQGSVYFGCREAHLPLEYGYARELLRAAGHDAKIFDAQLCGLDVASLRTEVRAFAPEMTVVTTAPSYLFWRCAPPELRVPMQTVRALRDIGGLFVAVGPHASTTPATTIQKLGVDVAVLGECEEVLLALATAGAEEFGHVDSIAYREASRDSRGEVVTRGPLNASDMSALPAIRWERELIRRHPHHHHRFDSAPAVPGAELESSRGCPYYITICAKQKFSIL